MFTLPFAQRQTTALKWSVFAAMMVIVFVILIKLFTNVGGFWRDEVSTLALVNKASIADVYSSLEIDSYPPLYVVLIRCWIALGLGSTALGIQIFGFLAFPFIVIALVLGCKISGESGPPLVATALLVFNPNVFYWSTALRAYGFAAGLIIIFFGLTIAMIRRQSRFLVVIYYLLAVFCVQANYQNSYLIFALCVSATVVCLLNRKKKRALIVFGAGFVSALSLIPYIPSILRVKQVDMLSRGELSLDFLFERVRDALSNQHLSVAVIWAIALISVMLVPVLLGMRSKRTDADFDCRKQYIFIFIAASVGIVTLVMFVKSVGYATMPWQYLPFMAFVACLTELLFVRICREGFGCIIRCLLAIVIASIGMMPIWQQSHLRRTNVDVIVDTLNAKAGAGDLVVVSPFYMAVSFNYHIKNSNIIWTSLPPVSGYDMTFPFPRMKAAMASGNPIASVMQSVVTTLKRGDNVWIVGNFDMLPPDQIPPVLSPAPHPTYGWNFGPYVTTWSMQLCHLLQQHAIRAENLNVIPGIAVFPYERLDVTMVSGWRESP